MALAPCPNANPVFGCPKTCPKCGGAGLFFENEKRGGEWQPAIVAVVVLVVLVLIASNGGW